MKNLQIIGLAVGIAMMTCGVNAQDAAQNAEVHRGPQAAALDKLMAAVGEQIDTAGREVKSFLQKAEGDMIEGTINIGINQMATQLKATPEQADEIRPILRKDVESTGEILDEALSVGLAAARESLTRSLDRQWRDVRAELSETLSTEQLVKADELHADLTARMVALFEQPPEQK